MKQSSCILEEIDPEDLLDEDQDYPSVHNYDLYNMSMHPDFAEHVQPPKKNSFSLDDPITPTTPTPPTTPAITSKFTRTTSKRIEEERSFLPSLANRTSSDSDHAPNEQQYAIFSQSIYSDPVGKAPPTPPRPPRKNEEELSYQQSYYMKPVEPTPTQQPPTKRQKPLPTGKEDLSVIFRVTSYFLEIGSISVEVDRESLQDMYDEFFRRELFIPLFNLNLHEEWTASGERSPFDPHFQPHRLFRVYLTRYAQYLSQKFPAVLREILPIILETQQGKGRKREHNSSTIASIFSFDWTALLQTIKQFVGASKTQMLRKTLLAKAKSVREAIKICETNSLLKDAAVLLECQERIWQDLGEVELLLSLQSTEEYCTRKMESSSEPKFKQIWVKYRDSIRQDKKQQLLAHLTRLPI